MTRPYPPTRTAAVEEQLHGATVVDPYRWLEDASSPEVQAWMTAQDAFARAELARLPERGALAARLRELLYQDALGAPEVRGGRYFYGRRLAEREKAFVCVRDGREGPERVLLDPNAWSADGNLSLGGWWPSWDGRLCAYQVKENNSDESATRIIDVATGALLPDRLAGTKYAGASWTPAGDGFYYTYLPPLAPGAAVADRPGTAEIRFHRLGTEQRDDLLVRPATGDPRTFVGVSLSRDGRWLLYSVQRGWRSTDLWCRDLATDGPWTPVVTGADAQYQAFAIWQGRMYVKTDEGAPRERVFVVDLERPARAGWTEIVPERPDATLEGASLVGGLLSLVYLKDVTSRLELRALDGTPVREVPLPTLGTTGGLHGDEDRDEAYFAFTSFTHPTEIHEVSVATGETRLWHRQKTPVDPSRFLVEQRFFASKDGTRVPMFVIRDRGLALDGGARALLTGYGGFRVSWTPSFMSSIYPWLERGGVYAIANLRGGAEYGEEWHRLGMKHAKQNVFDDFVAAAEDLIAGGYTRPGRLAISGGSNGGLLVGAALTQRPDLFAAVICAVPLLDMVRYHLFGSGKTWIEEYGSADDPDDFRVLLAYSPYHHVKDGVPYPALLMDAADSDDRVDPMHARKFVALLQRASAGGPVLLRIERNAGHGGADQVRATVERLADQYAFALAHTA